MTGAVSWIRCLPWATLRVLSGSRDDGSRLVQYAFFAEFTLILSKKAAVLLRLIVAIALPLTTVAQDSTEPESLYRIARFLLVPDSNRDEITRGLGYLKRSADGGYEPAARDYAQRLEMGIGVPKDEMHARHYYQLAAAQGDTVSQLALASMLEDGRGGEKNEDAAFSLRGEAAATGHPAAQYALGYTFALGLGTGKNPGTAAFWFRLAAEQGHRAAQSSLGMLYRIGRGLPQDREQAIYWYRRAAEQGDTQAVNALVELERRDDRGSK